MGAAGAFCFQFIQLDLIYGMNLAGYFSRKYYFALGGKADAKALTVRLLFCWSRSFCTSRRPIELLLDCILFWRRIHEPIKTIKSLILFL
jgi:hypothetical protein